MLESSTGWPMLDPNIVFMNYTTTTNNDAFFVVAKIAVFVNKEKNGLNNRKR